jgi:hypothetical protein
MDFLNNLISNTIYGNRLAMSARTENICPRGDSRIDFPWYNLRYFRVCNDLGARNSFLSYRIVRKTKLVKRIESNSRGIYLSKFYVRVRVQYPKPAVFELVPRITGRYMAVKLHQKKREYEIFQTHTQ